MSSPKEDSTASVHFSRWPLILVLAIGLSALIWFFRSGPAPVPVVKPSTPLAPPSIENHPSATTLSGETGRSAEPLSPEDANTFAQYAGSASCAGCHQDQHSQWKTSNHCLAERAPSAALDQSAFEPSRSFQHGGQHTDLSVHGGQFQITALGLNKTYEALSVDRVIGHDPLRQYLVPFSDGRFQVLEAAYDPKRNDWFNVFGAEDRQPGEWGHWSGRGMNWNNMCAGCHNTRLRKNYAEKTDSYSTSKAELSVGCEACHGPMKSHVQWRQTHPDATNSEPTLKKLTRDQAFDTCGQCHSRRMELTGDFVPGSAFQDHFVLSIVDNSENFYPDGQVHDEDYEYAAFLGSNMHKAGVRCVDCHNPHTAKVRLPGNALCMTCHAEGAGAARNFPSAPVIDQATHSFHKVDPLNLSKNADLLALSKRNPDEVAKNGGECLNCHMPQTTYMQRHRRHDHGFTTPDPVLTQRFAIPNACNRCHADKDAAWAVTWTEKWYGDKMNRPSRQRASALAAARRGDASTQNDLLAMLAAPMPAQSDPPSKRETVDPKSVAPYWAAAAAHVLERGSTDPAVTAALIAATRHPSALVRSSAAQSLAPLAGSEFTDVDAALRKLLDDPALAPRFFAEWALRASVDPASAQGRELRAVLDAAADQPVGQMQLGAYFTARNEPEKALEHYRKAATWDPNSAGIRHDYAVLLSALNQPQEAARQLEAACALEPNEADYRYELALAFNELHDMPKAIEALREAVRLAPNHARAWYNLGLALNMTDKKEEALQALLKAETAEPRDPRNPYARATILSQLGRKEEARKAAIQTLNIQRDYTPALELLRELGR